MRGVGVLGMALVAVGSIVAVAPLVFTGACSVDQACCGACPEGEPAVFELSCASTDLQGVTLTGPCAGRDEAADYTLGDGKVYVWGATGGACHVELAFASGFTFGADVTFATEPGGVCGGPQCKCPDYGSVTSPPVVVHNPASTCVATVVDAAPPACVGDASDGVACSTTETCVGCRDQAQYQCTCTTSEGGEADAAPDAVPSTEGPTWQCTATGFPCDRSL
jgi:hypothetical protein